MCVAMRSTIINGPAVKLARELAGLTQEDVASRLKVHRATVAGWERASPINKPSGVNFKALCKLLKVRQRDLLLTTEEAA